MSKTPMLDKINALIEWLKQGRLSISFKEAQWLCEQIQDMQDEIKRLKETNEEHRKINGQLREDLIVMNNKNMELVKVIDELETMLKEYKHRLMHEKYTNLESKGLMNGQLFAYGIILNKLNELKGGSND